MEAEESPEGAKLPINWLCDLRQATTPLWAVVSYLQNGTVDLVIFKFLL